jgi:hypothetical protein
MNKLAIIRIPKVFETIDRLNTSGKILCIKEPVMIEKLLSSLNNFDLKSEDLIDSKVTSLIDSLNIQDVLDSDEQYLQVIYSDIICMLVELYNALDNIGLYNQSIKQYTLRVNDTDGLFQLKQLPQHCNHSYRRAK